MARRYIFGAACAAFYVAAASGCGGSDVADNIPSIDGSTLDALPQQDASGDVATIDANGNDANGNDASGNDASTNDASTNDASSGDAGIDGAQDASTDATVEAGALVFRGAFVGGGAAPGSNSNVKLNGVFVWQGAVQGQNNGVRINGWMR